MASRKFGKVAQRLPYKLGDNETGGVGLHRREHSGSRSCIRSSLLTRRKTRDAAQGAARLLNDIRRKRVSLHRRDQRGRRSNINSSLLPIG